MEKFKSLNEEEQKEVSGMRDAVVDILLKKAMYEMKECNKNNPAHLGGVKFYFEQTSEGPYLLYDKHPREWNEQEIKEDVDRMEYYFLQLRGLVE